MKIKDSTVFIFAVYLLMLIGANIINQTYPDYSSIILAVLLEIQIVAYFTAIYLSSKNQ